MYKKTCLATLLLMAVLAAPAAADWKLEKTNSGIEVYKRASGLGQLEDFRGVTDLDAPIEVVLEVMKCTDDYHEWYAFCKDCRVIKDLSSSPVHRIVYYECLVPWPLTERDMVLDFEFSCGSTGPVPDRVTVNVDAEPSLIEMVPRDKKHVRVSVMQGRFEVSRIDDNTTRFDYSIHTDPAGRLPEKGVNRWAWKQPYQTLKGIKKQIKKEKYWEKAGVNKG